MIIGIFTLLGLITLILNTGVFILSFFLKNLFLQYLCGSILFFYLYFIISYVILYMLFRKNRIEPTNLRHGIIHPFETATFLITLNRVPIHLPGMHWYIAFNLHEGDHVMQHIISHVEFESSNQLRLTTRFNRHGHFMLRDLELHIRDLLGFTVYRIRIDYRQSLTIQPWFTDSIDIPYVLDKGGDQIIQSVVKVDSTDFFENRKYYPGDDTRKINWSLFAHSGELHIRDVEKTPPKIGQVTFIFAPWSENDLEYEHCTSLFMTTIYYLLQSGLEVKIISPASDQAMTIDDNNEKGLVKIINNSHRQLPADKTTTDTPFIIFASYAEYQRLTNIGSIAGKTIKNSIAYISFFEQPISTGVFFKLAWQIHDYDRFIPEIRRTMQQLREYKQRSRKLEVLKNRALAEKIQLEVLSVNETLFAND